MENSETSIFFAFRASEIQYVGVQVRCTRTKKVKKKCNSSEEFPVLVVFLAVFFSKI